LNAAIFLFIYRLFGLKTVLRYSSADRLHKKWGFLGRNALRLCEAQLRFAKTVIVVSENYQVDLRKRLKLQNVVVVPNGIDVVERASQDDSDCFWNSYCPEDARFVLTVGRLTVDKGFESLIEAVKAIEDRNLRLFIVGGVSEEEYAEKLRNLADDRVYFLGRLDRNEIHRLYEKCALYVNCSYFEGLSNALLEAISHDCPLVVSDIVANVEMPLREESYFPVGDVEALTECIKRALNKPSDFKAKKTDFLSWEDVADLMEKVYLNIEPDWRARHVEKISEIGQ
jgi:glycosyltransferase involved in cell wall biosynthesis